MTTPTTDPHAPLRERLIAVLLDDVDSDLVEELADRILAALTPVAPAPQADSQIIEATPGDTYVATHAPATTGAEVGQADTAVRLAHAILTEYPHIAYGLRIPSSVAENIAAERAYHEGNIARFLMTVLEARALTNPVPQGAKEQK